MRHLRRWLTGLLPDCPERDDLISVAVELGTNAVQHTASGAGGWFTVAVTRRATVVRLDVTDEGGPCGPQAGGDPMSDCGRGVGPGRCDGTRRGACPQRLPGAQNPPHPPRRLPPGQRFLTVGR